MRPGNHRILLVCAAAVASSLGAFALAQESEFETPPIFLVASDILPEDILSGPNYRVLDQVENDGYMNNYQVESDFGEFAAEGTAALRVRIAEIEALAQLAEITRTDAFVDALQKSATRQYRAAETVIKHPVDTAKGLPGGVKRLVKRTSRQVQDLSEDAKEEYGEYKASKAEKKAREAEKAAAIEAGELPPEEEKGTVQKTEEWWDESGQDVAKKGADMGTEYGKKWIGYSGARRRFAGELGVDPYTDNPVLNRELNRVSQAATAGGLTMRFVPVPRFDVLGYMKDANQLVWKMDPLDLRLRNEKLLYEMGVSEEEVEALYDNKFQSPTLITVLVNSIVALDGVEGRTGYVELARDAGSRVEASYHVRTANFFAEYHQKKSPLTHIVNARFYPQGLTADGRLALASAMDYVHWTEDLAALVDEHTPEAVEQTKADALEVWIEGSISDLARQGLERHGYAVHPQAFFGLEVTFGESGDTGDSAE